MYISLGYICLERNGTSRAVHRMKYMDLPNKNTSIFFENRIPNLGGPIVLYEETEIPKDMRAGVFKKFSILKSRNQYSTRIQYISDCTTIFIISRKGLYTVHFVCGSWNGWKIDKHRTSCFTLLLLIY